MCGLDGDGQYKDRYLTFLISQYVNIDGEAKYRDKMWLSRVGMAGAGLEPRRSQVSVYISSCAMCVFGVEWALHHVPSTGTPEFP